jgi:hypothetical protein
MSKLEILKKLPKEVLEVVGINHFYEHEAHGWYANNSIRVGDICPVYRNSGGGVMSDQLTTLDQAFDDCIDYLGHRISEANKHIDDLRKAKEALRKAKEAK